MAQRKQYKPRTCVQCPVIKNEKGILVCAVMRELKANIRNDKEKLNMWRNCPIGWDK